MPITLLRAAVLGEADQHAGVRRAGHGADDDVVEPEAELPLLRAHLLGEADEAETAVLVHRGARRNRIGLAALCSHVIQSALPARPDPDVEAFVDQLDLGAQHAAHQDVADAVVDGIREGHPALLHEAALHAELRRDRRDLARMVRLHAADGHERIGIGRERVGNDVLELADLVAAEREARVAVLALGIDLDRAAEMRRQTVELLDRRRAERERVALELLQHHRSSQSDTGWRIPCRRSRRLGVRFEVLCRI